MKLDSRPLNPSAGVLGVLTWGALAWLVCVAGRGGALLDVPACDDPNIFARSPRSGSWRGVAGGGSGGGSATDGEVRCEPALVGRVFAPNSTGDCPTFTPSATTDASVANCTRRPWKAAWA